MALDDLNIRAPIIIPDAVRGWHSGIEWLLELALCSAAYALE